jgi:hypothetical protein
MSARTAIRRFGVAMKAHMLGPGQRLQMLRIDAESLSASVMDVVAFRDGAERLLVGQSVSTFVLPSTDIDDAIAGASGTLPHRAVLDVALLL